MGSESDITERARSAIWRHTGCSDTASAEAADAVCAIIEEVRISARTARNAALDEAAEMVRDNQETIREGRDGTERYLSPRKEGNLTGLAFAAAIESLKKDEQHDG